MRVLTLFLFLWPALGCHGEHYGHSRPDRPFVAGRETSKSCVYCHGDLESDVDSATMHEPGTVQIGCTDCHGGDATETDKEKAHVQPHYPDAWPEKPRWGNPVRQYSDLNKEHPSYIRFVNPGDLRVAGLTCGGCHASEVRRVRKSMMAHGAMLWGAALYNNGVINYKNPRHGEAYGPDGTPLRLRTTGPVDTESKGQLPFLDPLPRFEIGQPSNILRVFERGGRFLPPLPGIPNPLQEPGKPDKGLSPRGLGTLNRTDPVWLNLQKTRLLDPLLYMFGTNDHPGDYRSSGCTACHVVYANDREPDHSADFGRYGNDGRSFSKDLAWYTPEEREEIRAGKRKVWTKPADRPARQKKERGHPIGHRFTKAIPTSQCIVCHIHPGTTVTNTYTGTLWWDNESDGHEFYPKEQRYPTEKERLEILQRNPEEAATRGNWSDPGFLKRSGTPAFNKKLETVQIADFHGHGWLFRKVYRRDRQGHLLDEDGRRIAPTDPKRFAKDGGAVHLKDIHLERGMHCVDCHFEQDVHGNGHLYGAVRDAIEITCENCHGTIEAPVDLTKQTTTGPAAPAGEKGHYLRTMRTPFKTRRFVMRDGELVMRSSVYRDKEWTVPQIADGEKRNPKSWRAKTVRRHDGELAHGNERMTCFSCHTAWMASCFGCHLPMRANQMVPYRHNEGDLTRNYTPYNWQTIRADTYMLGIDGDVTKNRIAPARSACAVMVGSQNANREWVYSQQQTVSAEGYSGIAFSTHVPHTVRKTETKSCTDCHLSEAGDNNALMAQLLMQGTGFMNFMYRWVYVGTDTGIEAVVVTERDEPQAVIGSTLHKDAFPDFFKQHLERERKLPGGFLFHYRHPSQRANSVQLRGEYLYIADGPGGFRIFDVAQIDQKGFSERITTAPISPLDQRFFVDTKNALSVASPTTLGVDPTRRQYAQNKEQEIHLLYAFLYVADKEEGLVMTTAASLLDGNPRNNRIERFKTVNPKALLKGARFVTVAGRFVYVGCDKGLVVVDVHDPTKPQVAAVLPIRGVRGVAVQFRYAFVACADGLKAVDITPEVDGSFPKKAEVVSTVALPDARQVYVARTFAYVAAGKQGLAIVDVESPTAMKLVETFDAKGVIDDCNDVKIGITNTSLFAYLADGKNGLRVLQLTSPYTSPDIFGFSPRPRPQLIATRPTKGRALSLGRGLDRDRAVDEAGNQLSVFNRVGSRPFRFDEMLRFYRKDKGTGEVFFVRDE